VSLWLTSLLLPGMQLGDGADSSIGSEILIVLAVALIFAIVDAVIKPILELLALPITCVTLGLFMLVINALMLLLTAWIASLFSLPLAFDSFWWALLAGVIIGLLSSIFEAIVGINRSED
jgi:putative membrane protein